MDEIRFTPPAPKKDSVNSPMETTKEPKVNRFGFVLKISKILAVLALFTALFFGVKYLYFLRADTGVDKDAYSAVFLANGQVYFGKIIENNKDEVVLKDVFYLQINNQNSGSQLSGGGNQNSFNLIKMGNELHGPTNELFINKTQVVFYEYLREDSKVVESIKNYK